MPCPHIRPHLKEMQTVFAAVEPTAQLSRIAIQPRTRTIAFPLIPDTEADKLKLSALMHIMNNLGDLRHIIVPHIENAVILQHSDGFSEESTHKDGIIVDLVPYVLFSSSRLFSFERQCCTAGLQ